VTPTTHLSSSAILAEKRQEFVALIDRWRINRADMGSPTLQTRPDVKTAIMESYDQLISVFTSNNPGQSMEGRTTELDSIIARVMARTYLKFEALQDFSSVKAMNFTGSIFKQALGDFEAAHGVRMRATAGVVAEEISNERRLRREAAATQSPQAPRR